MDANHAQKKAIMLVKVLMQIYDTQKDKRLIEYQIAEAEKSNKQIIETIADYQQRSKAAETLYNRLAGRFSATVQGERHLVEFALYSLESCYRTAGNGETANAIRLMGYRTERGGNIDASSTECVFINLSRQQYDWILEALKNAVEEYQEAAKERQAGLSKSRKEITKLQNQLEVSERNASSLRKTAEKIATDLDTLEMELWGEKLGRGYNATPADYTNLVILRLNLYEYKVRREVGEYNYCLTKYAQPADGAGNFLIDMGREEIREQHLVNIDVERVTPFHCIVYRPPCGTTGQIALKSVDRYQVEGYVNESAVFEVCTN